MLFRYLYKLVIHEKPGEKSKVLYVVFLFTFKNFVHKTRAKFVPKENGTVIKVTSTLSSDICWS